MICLPLFPRQLTQTKHTARASQIFCGETSFWLTHSFASAKFKRKKERKKCPQHRPLGLFFVVPFVVIDSSEHDRPSVLRHCPKSYLNLACFAATVTASQVSSTLQHQPGAHRAVCRPSCTKLTSTTKKCRCRHSKKQSPQLKTGRFSGAGVLAM